MTPPDALLSSRREFLAAAAWLCLPALHRPSSGAVVKNPSFSKPPFSLGVASGDPDATSVVLWTRLAPEPLEGGGMPPAAVEVGWELAEDEHFSKVVRKGVEVATPQLGHSVHVLAKGLEPARTYWYRFHAGKETSPVGRTKTMPSASADPDRLRFAFASCQHFEAGFFTAYEHMAKRDLDLVFHLGDYIYEGAGRKLRPGLARTHVGKEIEFLDEYRNRHAQYKSDPHLQAAHAAFPWVVTWDDHEFANNYAGAISEKRNVDSAAFLARRANAYQAYYEHMPLRPSCLPLGPDMRLYRGVRFGRLAEFAVLDTRQFRGDQPNGDGIKPLVGAVLDPSATMLGAEQEKWLQASLLRSKATWNVLAQQVMMARVDRRPGELAEYSMDQWSGYDAPRKRLLEFLASRRIPNPVVLTGDIHSNWCNDLLVDFDQPTGPIVATEFVGTSISSEGDGRKDPPYLSDLLSENPFVKFHNRERGYVECEATPRTLRADYQVVEYVTRPGAPLATRASFVVESGRPGAKKA